MKTYRCTRNAPYQNQLVLERDRQGHYVMAESELDALARMLLTFPDDTHGFTVELWSA